MSRRIPRDIKGLPFPMMVVDIKMLVRPAIAHFQRDEIEWIDLYGVVDFLSGPSGGTASQKNQ